MEDRAAICFLFLMSIFLVFLIVWPKRRIEGYASCDAYYLNSKTGVNCPHNCPGNCDVHHCKSIQI